MVIEWEEKRILNCGSGKYGRGDDRMPTIAKDRGQFHAEMCFNQLKRRDIMRKLRLLLAVAFLMISLLVTIPAQAQINGLMGEEPDAIFPQAAPFSVEIRDNTGVSLDTVRVSNPWTYAVTGYWVRFGGATWTKARVTINLFLSGLPEKDIVQHYEIPAGYPGNTFTPFALTDWAGSLYGTGKVSVALWNGATAVGTVSKTFSIMPYDSSSFTFNKRKNQLIDDTTSGSCVGEAVATVTLNSGSNKLYVSFGWPSGDLDMSVQEPDGSCAFYGNPTTPSGGHHSGDAAAGGIESYYIVNGPPGVYTIRAHTHSGSKTATVHIYGAGGSVDLTPAAVGFSSCSECMFDEGK